MCEGFESKFEDLVDPAVGVLKESMQGVLGDLTQIYAGNALVACCPVARAHKPVQDLVGWSTSGCWCPAVERSLEVEVVEKSSASTPEAPNIHESRLKTCREENLSCKMHFSAGC